MKRPTSYSILEISTYKNLHRLGMLESYPPCCVWERLLKVYQLFIHTFRYIDTVQWCHQCTHNCTDNHLAIFVLWHTSFPCSHRVLLKYIFITHWICSYLKVHATDWFKKKICIMPNFYDHFKLFIVHSKMQTWKLADSVYLSIYMYLSVSKWPTMYALSLS